LQPSLWVALISVVAYWDTTALHGSFVYDDSGSVAKNVVVNGRVPWTEVIRRDFWGTSMNEPASHKSFRPITTLTFRLNWIYSEMETYSYHLVNVALHGLVCGLLVHVTAFVFDGGSESDLIAQLITGFLFGLHPVHAEAVSNITSRGEMLMSLFFLLAFLSYANNIPTTTATSSSSPSRTYSLLSFCAIYIAPMLCMALSLFSKEQGATALITIVVYDFLKHHSSVVEYLGALVARKDEAAVRFLRRTMVLAMETLAFCALRYWLNGETVPDFIVDQNPAGFSEDRFTRVFSVSWVYCLYIYDAVYPRYLCPDWSGQSIDLIRSAKDVRIVGVLILWTFAATCLLSLILGPPKDATPRYRSCRKVILMAFFAFTFSPFLLSSNLLVVVGLMKADRVIYLPLFGFCILEALLFKMVFCDQQRSKPHQNVLLGKSGGGVHWLGYMFIMIQLALFAGKVHERNLAWSDSLTLWSKAYDINPKSHHTMYNCGYEMSLKKQYERAERVMRPIGNAHVDGPSNTFVYAMILFNLNRCDDALRYIDIAMNVIEEKKRKGGTRNQPSHLARTESNLLVAKAHCAVDIAERGRILYEAVQKDQTNEYAIQQAQLLMERVQLMKQYQQNH
jgi:hypothetical protein